MPRKVRTSFKPICEPFRSSLFSFGSEATARSSSYKKLLGHTDTELLQIGLEESLDLIMRVFCGGPVVPQMICTPGDTGNVVRARLVESVHRTFIDLPLDRSGAALQACAAVDTPVRRFQSSLLPMSKVAGIRDCRPGTLRRAEKRR